MGQNPISQPRSKSIHIMYKSKLYEDKVERLRPLPLPVELSRRVTHQLKNKEVLVSIYELKDLEIELPWLIVQRIKRDLLNADKDDIKAYIAFLAYDAGNSYIRMILPSVPSIMLRDPETIDIIDDYINFRDQKIKVRRIVATDFWASPLEKPTKSIGIACELYDLPDELDYYNFSRCRIIIKLRQLLDELNIRWDLAR